jgi:hypothetical protein
MQPSRRDKLVAHAERVLDELIGLRAKYAMLRPLLFDRNTVTAWAAGKRGYGFSIIRSTLLESCVLEIAKIALDRDDRTPSLIRLDAALAEPPLLAELRVQYAVWNLAPTEGDDPDVIAILQASERREEEARRQEFDSLVGELRNRWAQLHASPALISFGKMRDKIVAHNELQFDGTKYVPLDVASLGLKYQDLDLVVAELDALVNLVNLVFRGAKFDFDGHDKQLADARDGFWNA